MNNTSKELYILSKKVKELVKKGEISESKELIISNLPKYPDSAEPHNLLGIVEEIRNNHVLAMKHFRAALALNPAYAPARENIDTFGSFEMMRKAVYNEDDIEIV